jgi:hypothetical protein
MLFKIVYLKVFRSQNNLKNTTITKHIIEYFNQYEAFCFDLSSNSVLKGELKFNFK